MLRKAGLAGIPGLHVEQKIITTTTKRKRRKIMIKLIFYELRAYEHIYMIYVV